MKTRPWASKTEPGKRTISFQGKYGIHLRPKPFLASYTKAGGRSYIREKY